MGTTLSSDGGESNEYVNDDEDDDTDERSALLEADPVAAQKPLSYGKYGEYCYATLTIAVCSKQWWYEVDVEATFRYDAIKSYPVPQYLVRWPTWIFKCYSHFTNYGPMLDVMWLYT